MRPRVASARLRRLERPHLQSGPFPLSRSTRPQAVPARLSTQIRAGVLKEKRAETGNHAFPASLYPAPATNFCLAEPLFSAAGCLASSGHSRRVQNTGRSEERRVGKE